MSVPIDSVMEDYTILEKIEHDETAVTYLASCKRGRLRNRVVAIKKIALATPSIAASTALHHGLHHPNIQSLLAFFPESSHYIQILELCANGTLYDYMHTRKPPRLEEDEFRGVLKSVVDALTYLRKELVIHRNLTPKNILLSNDYRPKLSNFNLAMRVPTVNSSINIAVNRSSSYTSPEMVSNLPYSFTTDLWSLGCLTFESLSGSLPFQAKSTSETFARISAASYIFPDDLSYEAKDLIDSLLQLEPTHRMPLHRMSSHPFLNPALPITTLAPTSSLSSGKENIHPARDPQLQTLSILNPDRPRILPRFPSKKSSPFLPSNDFPKHIPFSKQPGHVNVDLRNLLRDEMSEPVHCDTHTGNNENTGKERRIVSDPLPRGSLAAEFRALSVNRTTRSRSLSAWTRNTRTGACTIQAAIPDTVHGATDGTPYPRNLQTFAKPKLLPTLDSMRKGSANAMTKDIVPRADTPQLDDPTLFVPRSDSPSSCVAIGTTRPVPINASLLNPQVHRTIHGTLTILPSQSLLIDLRESERRRGKKGDEVLLVDSQDNVSVYSAPHLSSPSCLTEPIATYTLDRLPPFYWKSYNDASQLVQQIKQRTPELVMYKADAKCIMMANGPKGDLELVFRDTHKDKENAKTHHSKTPRSQEISKPAMRIRFSRQSLTLEIARYFEGDQGGEWTKRLLRVVDGTWTVSETDWGSLLETERHGINVLYNFLSTCESIEAGEKNEQSRPTMLAGSPHIITNRRSTIPLSTAPFARQTSSSSTDATVALTDEPSYPLHATMTTNPPQRLQESEDLELTTEGHGIQTRFIPAVGWCIRYASRVSQGGRYRIMFMDGAALDVDVDEEWAELTNVHGQVTRHRIRDCNSTRKLAERMGVFEEFVSMFDSSVSYL